MGLFRHLKFEVSALPRENKLKCERVRSQLSYSAVDDKSYPSLNLTVRFSGKWISKIPPSAIFTQLELRASLSEYFFRGYTFVVRPYVWCCELATWCLTGMMTMIPTRRWSNRGWTLLRSYLGWCSPYVGSNWMPYLGDLPPMPFKGIIITSSCDIVAS